MAAITQLDFVRDGGDVVHIVEADDIVISKEVNLVATASGG